VSDVVIRAEGLGKKYLIGHQAPAERYVALRDVIGRTARGFLRTARDTLRGRQLVAGEEIEEFWALRDVSFEVRRGEVMGIIGRNGAGKSTLLKVLSRITEPSAGRVEIRGRVASLLEVGTGFHQELTGRENIYLNGAILGMSRAEISAKFDEIVAFAEVERFLDTPVKRYSSGMYMRLAFAVAAHLEPEILVIDEVLAVGDAEFQRKCLGKMQDVAGHGRTVLFVSHNMGAIAKLCGSGLLLEQGRLLSTDRISAVIGTYRGRGMKARTGQVDKFAGPLRSVQFDELLLNSQTTDGTVTIMSDEDLFFNLAGRATADIPNFRFAFAIYREGVRLLTIHDGPSLLPTGAFFVSAHIAAELLRPGHYEIAAGGRRVDGDEWVWGTDLASFEVIPKWRTSYDPDDDGLINLTGRLKRTCSGIPMKQ
jgi:ABC-type polysaccharide/polyol phosphate transport system ATPase subunit